MRNKNTMASSDSLYLGFDLSTQQLKGIVVTLDLKVVYEAVFDFDTDASGFDTKKGVLTNEAEREVFAPVAMKTLKGARRTTVPNGARKTRMMNRVRKTKILSGVKRMRI